MAGMGELLHLARDRGHHPRVAVPGIHDRDPGGEVNITVALDIPDFAVERAIGIDLGHHPHTPGNRVVAAAGYIGVQHLWLHHGRTPASCAVRTSVTGAI